MKKICLVLCLLAWWFYPAFAFAQVNGGFETGDLTGWTTAFGLDTPACTVVGSGFGYNTGNNLVLPHGGNYCCQLYSGFGDNAHADYAQIYQSDVIAPGNAFLSVWIAASLNGHHFLAGNAYDTDAYVRFRITVGAAVIFDQRFSWYDNAAMLLPASPNPGYWDIGDQEDEWKYLPWTNYGYNLSAFVGQNVTVSYEAHDCDPSGHFCYGYIDDLAFGPTSIGTQIPTVTPVPTNTNTYTSTNTFTPSLTYTPSLTPTQTLTFTNTYTPSQTYTPSCTLTSSLTFTSSCTFTSSYTPTYTLTSSKTFTSTQTPTSTMTPTPTPQLRFNKSVSNVKINPGDRLSYTLAITNNGTGMCNNIVMWDSIASDFGVLQLNPTPTTNSPPLVAWNIGNMAPGGSFTENITVQLNTASQLGKLIPNHFQVNYFDTVSNMNYLGLSSNTVWIGTGNLLVYPNPFSLSQAAGQELKFVNVTPGSTIDIRTLSGRLVVSLHVSNVYATWDGRNDQGQLVAPGVYYYVISGGDTHRGKFLVKP